MGWKGPYAVLVALNLDEEKSQELYESLDGEPCPQDAEKFAAAAYARGGNVLNIAAPSRN